MRWYIYTGGPFVLKYLYKKRMENLQWFTERTVKLQIVGSTSPVVTWDEMLVGRHRTGNQAGCVSSVRACKLFEKMEPAKKAPGACEGCVRQAARIAWLGKGGGTVVLRA